MATTVHLTNIHPDLQSSKFSPDKPLSLGLGFISSKLPQLMIKSYSYISVYSYINVMYNYVCKPQILAIGAFDKFCRMHLVSVVYIHSYTLRIYTYTYICICNTFTPQIKGKSQCINVILHWLWNVNKIYTLILVRISH